MKSMDPLQHNLNLLNDAVPSMRYDGSIPFYQWQHTARIKLIELLGLPFEKCDDDMKTDYRSEAPDFTEIRFTFQSEPGYYVPCHFLIPSGKSHPLPVVICLQGHSKGMHISLGRVKYEDEAIEGDRDFAIRAVKEGYCALVMEQRNFGECGGTEKGPDCYRSTMTALLLGRTTVGERVWDVQRAIDVLLKYFPEADGNNIVCMGNSGGGTTTFYAACLDERIGYAMPSCAVCPYDVSIAPIHHCSCNHIPAIRKYFNMSDLCGLIAPRPLVIVAGKDDAIFPLNGVLSLYDTAKILYQSAGAENMCTLVIGSGGHRFYADDAWPVMNKYIGRLSSATAPVHITKR